MTLLRLIRFHQWYKNLLIFLPIIFGKEILNPRPLLLTVLGFAALCLISSTNYIINDIIDRKKDKLHPEKSKRPIASGKFPVTPAIILALIFFLGSITISLYLSKLFLFSVLGLFFLTQGYTFLLKDEPFVDILTIAVNFVIRAVAGTFVIVNNGAPYLEISPWLILCPFFLALFLSTGKRASELKKLKSDSEKHKKVYSHYTPEITRSLTIISTALLIMSYSLYSFSAHDNKLLITLPVVLYGILRYYYLIEQGHKISRKTHLVFTDKRLVITMAGFILMLFFIIYP